MLAAVAPRDAASDFSLARRLVSSGACRLAPGWAARGADVPVLQVPNDRVDVVPRELVAGERRHLVLLLKVTVEVGRTRLVDHAGDPLRRAPGEEFWRVASQLV